MSRALHHARILGRAGRTGGPSSGGRLGNTVRLRWPGRLVAVVAVATAAAMMPAVALASGGGRAAPAGRRRLGTRHGPQRPVIRLGPPWRPG